MDAVKVGQVFLRPHVYIPIIVFAIFYSVHFWLTAVQGETLYGGPGDHTAGLIWLYDHYPQSPWWRSTTASGYPWGDNLWSPFFLTGQIGYVLFWLFSKLLSSPVAGYNAYVALGLVISYILSYMFIYRRTIKKPILASLMALLVISTPAMFYAISVGHPSYVYLPAYLVGVTWLVQKTFSKGSFKYPVYTGLLVGSTALFDPYFALFVPVAAAVAVIVNVVYNSFEPIRLTLFLLLKKVMATIAGTMVIVIPLGLLFVSQSSGVNPINGDGGVLRGDAYAYSAQPEDYALPAVDNPFFPQSLHEVKKGTFHGNDPTFTLFLGYSILVLTLLAVTWWLRNYQKSTRNSRLLASIFILTAIVAFVLSLPPTITIFGVNFYMPTWIITEFISAWRVFARFYYVVQVSLVFFLAITAGEYLKSIRIRRRMTKFTHALMFVFVAIALVEYLPRNPFDSSNFWSYQTNLPFTYSKIRDSDASAIVEYPLREQPHFRGSVYLTGQHVHNKSLVNAYSPSNDKILVRLNIMDLNNPQTIPTLRFLGVDSIVVWNNKVQSWSATETPDMKLVSEESYNSKFGNDIIKTYDISKGLSSRYFGYVEKGFRPTEDLLYNILVPLQDGVAVGIIDLCDIVKRTELCQDAPSRAVSLRGTLINKSDDDVTIFISDADNNLIDRVVIGRNPLHLDLAGVSSKYTISFDSRYNEMIFFKDIHAVKDR